MLKIRYFLRDLYSYIFKYIPWIIIGFLLTFIIPGCEVNAATYGMLKLPDNAGMYNVVSASSVDKGQMMTKTLSVDSIVYDYDVIAFSTKYTYQTLGTTLGFTTDTIFSKSHTYTITIAVATGPGYTDRYFTLSNGIKPPLRSVGSASSHFYNYQANQIISSSVSNITTLINNQDFSQVSTISVTFRPVTESYSVVFNLNLNNTGSTTLLFLGYNVVDNGIDNSQQLNDINNSVNDVNNTISSSDVDTDALDDTQINNDNGIISAILTMPVDLISALIDGLSNNTTCTPLRFNLPFVNNEVLIPCFGELMNKMNFYIWWETTGAVAGGLVMFNYLIYLGKELHDMMTLKETRSEWGGL